MAQQGQLVTNSGRWTPGRSILRVWHEALLGPPSRCPIVLGRVHDDPADRMAAVLVNWNSGPDVLRMVAAMRAEYSGLTRWLWTMIPPTTTGHNCSIVCHDVLLDRLPENRGYGAGVNSALGYARNMDSFGLGS